MSLVVIVSVCCSVPSMVLCLGVVYGDPIVFLFFDLLGLIVFVCSVWFVEKSLVVALFVLVIVFCVVSEVVLLAVLQICCV